MDGDFFTEATLERACGYEVAVIGSYAFHVRKRAGCKVFRVTTDVVHYVYAETLRSTFATCTCAKARKSTARVVLCEHVAAAYMAAAQELEDGNVESGDE